MVVVVVVATFRRGKGGGVVYSGGENSLVSARTVCWVWWKFMGVLEDPKPGRGRPSSSRSLEV